MQFTDLLYIIQAQAKTIYRQFLTLWCPVKFFKYMLQVFGRNTNAIVSYFQHQVIALICQVDVIDKYQYLCAGLLLLVLLLLESSLLLNHLGEFL